MNMKKRYNLTIEQNHGDVTILGDSLKAKGFTFDEKHLWNQKENSFESTSDPQLRSSSHSTDAKVLEGNYIRINNLKYWGDSDHKNLLEALKMANTMTSDYKFEYGDIEDYEMEWDGDRSYPASFTFYSHKK